MPAEKSGGRFSNGKNGDPAGATSGVFMAKVWDRIAYMHLKNVDPAVRARVLAKQLSVEDSYGEGVMAPLPDGAVDIQAVMRFLEARLFTGPVVVEQDVAENAAETPLQLATRNFNYMQALS